MQMHYPLESWTPSSTSHIPPMCFYERARSIADLVLTCPISRPPSISHNKSDDPTSPVSTIEGSYSEERCIYLSGERLFENSSM